MTLGPQAGVERATVLLTSASGFVGGALLPALGEHGSIRCLVRDASRLGDSHRSLAVEADLSEPRSLAPALEGMDEVYYLVHSMEPGGDQGFVERDRVAAENYVRVAQEVAYAARSTSAVSGPGTRTRTRTRPANTSPPVARSNRCSATPDRSSSLSELR